MRCIKPSCIILAVAVLATVNLFPQQPSSPAPAPEVQTEESWEIALALYGYLLSGQDGYANPVLTADRGRLHLEARYNYEDLRTGSLWIGRNFQAGEQLVLHITPMVGGVFGRTKGIAPGCYASLSYRKLELSISNEYVFDTSDSSGSFYYSWPQLTYSPVDWLLVGLVAQHIKPFKTDHETQRGFLVGLSHKKAAFTVYVFNVGLADPSAALELSWNF